MQDYKSSGKSCDTYIFSITLYPILTAGKDRQHAGVAQLVEQLICNQQVGGSSPSASSNDILSWHIESPFSGPLQSGRLCYAVKYQGVW